MISNEFTLIEKKPKERIYRLFIKLNYLKIINVYKKISHFEIYVNITEFSSLIKY
jgi:hypothetical protein